MEKYQVPIEYCTEGAPHLRVRKGKEITRFLMRRFEENQIERAKATDLDKILAEIKFNLLLTLWRDDRLEIKRFIENSKIEQKPYAQEVVIRFMEEFEIDL